MVRPGGLKGPHTHETKTIPDIATVATMIWASDGSIVVVGHYDKITSVHKTYEEAEKSFLEAIDGIKNQKRYSWDTDHASSAIGSALEIVRKSFEMKMMYDGEWVKKFLNSTILTVQFTRIGKDAYILHNMETFKFLSDLSEIGTLVPELFLAKPKIPMVEGGPHGRYQDPEILKMLEQMRAGSQGGTQPPTQHG